MLKIPNTRMYIETINPGIDNDKKKKEQKDKR